MCQAKCSLETTWHMRFGRYIGYLNPKLLSLLPLLLMRNPHFTDPTRSMPDNKNPDSSKVRNVFV